MRFLHTADWHLGRLFHQVHLTDDQAIVLDQIVDIAKNEAVDVVIVAGDLYDRAVPPPEAVQLLNETWEKLVFELGIPVIAIPGNHDSSTRIGFGAKLLAKSGLHLISDFDSAIHPVTISNVDVYGLPYAEPAEIRAWSGNHEIRDHETAIGTCISKMKEQFHPDRPRILVGHAFVAGMSESESERPLSVGGSGVVSVNAFEPFHYTALGHLHAPQVVSQRCLYSGSPMKYSFSEANHQKSVVIGEISSNGNVTHKLIPLQSKKNVRDIKGTLQELIDSGKTDPNRDDYLRAILTDDGALLNAIGRLREVYPNVMQLERNFLQTIDMESEKNIAQRKEASETELFEGFFNEVIGNEPSADELGCFNEVADEFRRLEMESGGSAS